MMDKKGATIQKPKLHLRNKHLNGYDFNVLRKVSSELSMYIKPNKYGNESIDFSNPDAVKYLNKALLKAHYGIDFWDVPKGYLVPPIPGRADYIHYIADLLRNNNFGNLPTGSVIKCLDVGVGASCIYPILGFKEYGWSFIGSDIDSSSIASSQKIIDNNIELIDNIELRLQKNTKDILYGVLQKEEFIDMTICNPPFHASQEEALKGTKRKLKNLNLKKTDDSGKTILNFGGKSNELWCEGGEKKFLKILVRQSKKFAKNCFWYTSLVSKQSNLKGIYNDLKQANAIDIVTIPMGQGNKSSRIVAWTFLSKKEQLDWKKNRWK